MDRLPLAMVDVKRDRKGRKARKKPKDYEPAFPRNEQRKFCQEVLAAPGLAAAADIVKRWAMEFKPATATANTLGRVGKWSGWQELLLKVVKGFRSAVPSFDLVSLEGNAKLGRFAVWSTLPLFTCPGMGECGKWCYSVKGWRCPGSLARQLHNTMFLKFRPGLVRESFLALPAGITFRLYVDGDFDSLETIRFWMDCVWARPDVNAYGYSKSWELLWQYHTESNGVWPRNYLLNLSSGGRKQKVTAEQMKSLPIYRGEFIAVPIHYRPIRNGKPFKGNIGVWRYQDPEYHKAVLKAARERGIKKAFSCPGKCDACTKQGHACGTERFKGVPVVIGIH